jgi:hypothetical protein
MLTCASLLLAAPAIVALPGGGHGDEPRLVAGVVAWLIAAVAVLASPCPLPRTRAGRLALAGLAALALLTLASVAWAPLKAPAYADAQRVVLYLGVFVAALALLPLVPAAAAESALAACAVAVVGYGLSERVVPGLVSLQASAAAGGRLHQPLGYWNAMGAVAAIGLVLVAGIAGDPRRGVRARALAMAAAPLLGAGVALSYSRGALLAAAVGVAVTLVARAHRPQVRASVLAVALALAAGVLAAAPVEGAGLGAVLALGAAAGALAQAALARREAGGRLATAALPRGARRAIGAGAALAAVAALVLIAAGDSGPRTGTPDFGATTSRLGSVQSSRYDYWRVAVATWADHPVAGVGASGFSVEWLQRRTVRDAARDAHSLPLETAAELGLLGLLALAALAGGVAMAARGAPAAALGGLAAWTAHACIDWAWELPGDALFGILLAAVVLSAAERRARGPARAG